jgi:hypothetical protein
LQRDISVSLDMLGDVLVAQNDLPGARARFQESYDIAKRLATADPSSASLQRDVVASLWNLAGLENTGAAWERVVSTLEDMQRRGVLRPADVRYIDEARARARSQTAK